MQNPCVREVLVHLRDVHIGYERSFFGPLQLALGRGEMWGVVGPNGAGKTTLAKTILGILPPLGGHVEISQPNLRFSYTPQRHRLNAAYPLTAMEVVLMARHARLAVGGRPTAEDRRRAEEELVRLNIDSLAGQLFRSLSGGQQQRVLLARALASDPDILVLDEPSEGLDLLGTSDILVFLKKVNMTGRMAVLMISHHLDDVINAVDHLCFVNQYTNVFEAGSVKTMASPEKLTRLFGRSVDTYHFSGKTHIRVREE